MVLWSYGTGNGGVGDGELAGPHMAEEDREQGPSASKIFTNLIYLNQS